MDLRKCHIFGIIFTASVLTTPFEAQATAWAKYKELERANAARVTAPKELPWTARLWWDKAHRGTAAAPAPGGGRSRSARQPSPSRYAAALPVPTRGMAPISVQLPGPLYPVQGVTQSARVPRPMTQPSMLASTSAAQPLTVVRSGPVADLELARLQAVSIFGVHFTDPAEDCAADVYRNLLTSAVGILESFTSHTTEFRLLQVRVSPARVDSLKLVRTFAAVRDAIATELLFLSKLEDARDFIAQFDAVLAVSEDEIVGLQRTRFEDALGSVFRGKLGNKPFDWTNETRLGRRVLREMAKSLRNHLTDSKDAFTKLALADLLRRADEEVEVSLSSGKETKRISMLEYDADLYDKMFDAVMKAYNQLASKDDRDLILSGVRHSFEAEEQARREVKGPTQPAEKSEKTKDAQKKTRSGRVADVEALFQNISSAEQNRARSERQLRDALAIIYDMNMHDRKGNHIYVRGSRDLRSRGAFIGNNSIDNVKRRVQEFLGAIEEADYKTFKEHFGARARARRAVEKITQKLGAPVMTPEDHQNLAAAFRARGIEITPTPAPQGRLRFGQRQKSAAELEKEQMRRVFEGMKKDSDLLELAEAYLLAVDAPRT